MKVSQAKMSDDAAAVYLLKMTVVAVAMWTAERNGEHAWTRVERGGKTKDEAWI